MNNMKVLINGIVRENPTFVLVLGMCPTLAVTTAAINGIGMGLGFTLALTVIGFCRELIGSGSVFGYEIIPADFHISIFVMAPGAFFVLAALTALQNRFKAPSATNVSKEEREARKRAGEKLGCDGNCQNCMLHAEEIAAQAAKKAEEVKR